MGVGNLPCVNINSCKPLINNEITIITTANKNTNQQIRLQCNKNTKLLLYTEW